MTQYDETQLLLTDALAVRARAPAPHPAHPQSLCPGPASSATAQRLPAREQRIVQAAAILHDIAIGPCKQKYGEATQDKQQKEAPAMVRHCSQAAEYPKRTSRESCTWCTAITHTTAWTGWTTRP